MSKVLIVSDSALVRTALHSSLSDRGHDVSAQDSTAALLAHAATENFDVVVADASLNDGDEDRGSGFPLCARVNQLLPGVPVVLITAHGNLAVAVEALRAGAFDFVTQPVSVERLLAVVDRAARERSRPVVSESGRPPLLLGRGSFPGAPASPDGESVQISGNSPAVVELRQLLSRIAGLDSCVLITGESGSGKAHVARALHQRGKRSGGSFIAVNCAAVPDQLVEAELFGQVDGAGNERPGCFTRAAGGTLFLDEVSELPLRVQPRLLRALQEQLIRPVGADDERPCDVRVITATTRNLETEVEQGRFRADLYYSVNVLHVPVPPLRSRGVDILLYARQFIEHFTHGNTLAQGLSQQATERLLCYDWPGNLRELQNCMERAVALTQGAEIGLEDLPERVRHNKRSYVRALADEQSQLVSLEEMERRHVLRVLEATSGNKTLAAQILGVDRRTLHRKCGRYDG